METIAIDYNLFWEEKKIFKRNNFL